MAGLLTIFGKIDVEVPAFKLIKKMANYEIREYPASIHATVNDVNDSSGFNKLAGYIFGANKMNES